MQVELRRRDKEWRRCGGRESKSGGGVEEEWMRSEGEGKKRGGGVEDDTQYY